MRRRVERVWFLAFALYACASPSLAPAPDPFLSFALTLSPYISQKLPLLAIHTGICGFLRLLLAPLRIYTLEQTTPLCGPCALLWVAARERESESHTEMSPGRRYMFNAHPVARSVCVCVHAPNPRQTAHFCSLLVYTIKLARRR